MATNASYTTPRDMIVAEMGKQKLAHDSTAPTVSIVRQAPDVMHVGVKARQLLRNGRVQGGIQRSYAISPQYFQQLGERGSQFVAQPTVPVHGFETPICAYAALAS